MANNKSRKSKKNQEEIVKIFNVDPSNFFDIYSWIDTLGSLPKTTVSQKKSSYSTAQIVYDITAPEGIVILNENKDSGGIAVHQFSAFGSSTSSDSATTSDKVLEKRYEGFRFSATASQTVKSLILRLKRSANITNNSNSIKLLLYSDNNGTPDQLLSSSSNQILFSQLGTTYAEFEFDITSDIVISNSYWFVLDIPTYPLTSDNAFISLAYVSDSSLYSTSQDSLTWTKSAGRAFYKITGENTDSLSDTTVAVDLLDNPVRPAVSFGGSENESSYELIGYGNVNYLTKYFELTNGVYPEVSSIVVGATTSKAKQYSIEIKTSPTDTWKSVYRTIADEYSTDFLKYTFSTPVRLSNIRMSYRGDYYTSSNTGSFTLAGQDSLSDIESFQASHYTDFRDAIDFPNASTDGWVSFTEGISTFNWDFVNESRVWTKQTNTSVSPLTEVIAYGSKLIIASGNKFYKYSENQLSLVQSLAGTVTITCITLHKGSLYAGTSNGMVYYSSSGESWVIINPPVSSLDLTPVPLQPIKSLGSYRGLLWVGTSRTSTLDSAIYSWDDTSFSKVKTFSSRDILSLSSGNNNLYVATGGRLDYMESAIYKYNGKDWSLILDTEDDRLDCLYYSSNLSLLFAATSNGNIWTYDNTTFTKIFETDNTGFFDIYEDISGTYVWFAGDKTVVTYKKSDKSFGSLSYPSSIQSGLAATYRSSDSINYKSFDYEVSRNDKFESDFNFTNLDTSNPLSATSYYNVVYTGYINPVSTNVYDIKLSTNTGVRVYLNDELFIDSWTNKTVSADVIDTFNFTLNSKVKIEVRSFIDTVSTPAISLLWRISGVGSYVTIPSSVFTRPGDVYGVSKYSTSLYTVNKDGNVYLLDDSNLNTTDRNIYVRLKDKAGNYHGSPVYTGVYNFYQDSDHIKDNISIGTQTVNGTAISDGKIYQIGEDKQIKSLFVAKTSEALYSPDRVVRATGTYEVLPQYIATLTRWDTLTLLTSTPAGTTPIEGLDSGTEVKIYIRSGNSRDECLAADWGVPFSYGTIGNSTNAGLNTSTFNISTVPGKWIQYKIELASATNNLSAEVRAVTISYVAADSSYFFTKVFDTSAETADAILPEFRRGLLTSNQIPNGGNLVYGYTIDTDPAVTFDFTRYTIIEPNRVFEMPTTSSKIRIGILFVSVGVNPAIVNDFAVQFDLGESDLKLMD